MCQVTFHISVIVKFKLLDISIYSYKSCVRWVLDSWINSWKLPTNSEALHGVQLGAHLTSLFTLAAHRFLDVLLLGLATLILSD